MPPTGTLVYASLPAHDEVIIALLDHHADPNFRMVDDETTLTRPSS